MVRARLCQDLSTIEHLLYNGKVPDGGLTLMHAGAVENDRDKEMA